MLTNSGAVDAAQRLECVVPLGNPTTPLPAAADVVIIGGGVMGVSTAYHLAEAGSPTSSWSKGRARLRFHRKAAGGVRAQFSDAVNIELGRAACGRSSVRRVGQEIDLHQVGYLFLLDEPEHVAAFERTSPAERARRPQPADRRRGGEGALAR